MKKLLEGYCNKPDRDGSGTVCGHPLPCPYHTIIIDTTAKPVPTITIPATESKRINQKNLKKLKKISNILKDS